MIPNSMMFRAASALITVGIVLVLANWFTKPEAALAWTAVLAILAVMIAALRWSRLAVRRSTMETTAARQITTAVVFAALMMGIPLALTLARSFGFVDGFDVALRSTGVLTGAFLAMLGNVIPKNLPPFRRDATAHGNKRFTGSPAGRGCCAVLRRRSVGSCCRSTSRRLRWSCWW